MAHQFNNFNNQQQQWQEPQPHGEDYVSEYEQPLPYYPEQSYPPMSQPYPQWQQPIQPYQQGYMAQPYPHQPLQAYQQGYMAQPYPQSYRPHPSAPPYSYPAFPINVNVNVQNTATANTNARVVQVPPRGTYRTFWRILYFLCIGWWAGLFWAELAICFCITIIGFGVGVQMLKQVPAVLFLKGS